VEFAPDANNVGNDFRRYYKNYINKRGIMTRQERLKEAQGMRDEYIKAEKAVLKSQSYNIGGQSLTRANLTEIRKGRDYWQGVIDSLTGGRQIIRRIIPVDD
jgi:hypothetical protein